MAANQTDGNLIVLFQARITLDSRQHAHVIWYGSMSHSFDELGRQIAFVFITGHCFIDFIFYDKNRHKNTESRLWPGHFSAIIAV